MFNPDIAVAIYCGLQTLAATLVSLRFAAPRYDLLQNLGLNYRNLCF
jgi:hypothetical protein